MKIKNKILNKKSIILKFINNETISIHLETYYYLNLDKKDEIDLKLLKDTDAYYECLYYALKIIKKRDYSQKKLKEKLCVKFKKSTVNLVLIRLYELSLLNDDSSILNIIDNLIKNNYGPNKIKAKLIEKGYNISDIDFDKFNYHIEACAQKYLNIHKNEEDLCKLQQKLFRYLYNKGYNEYDIYTYLRNEFYK